MSRGLGGAPFLDCAVMVIGVIGMGYVGLPLAVAFANEGHEVTAVDVDRRKVDALRRGESYVEDVSKAALAETGGRIQATTRFASLAKCDAILVCVPTP